MGCRRDIRQQRRRLMEGGSGARLDGKAQHGGKPQRPQDAQGVLPEAALPGRPHTAERPLSDPPAPAEQVGDLPHCPMAMAFTVRSRRLRSSSSRRENVTASGRRCAGVRPSARKVVTSMPMPSARTVAVPYFSPVGMAQPSNSASTCSGRAAVVTSQSPGTRPRQDVSRHGPPTAKAAKPAFSRRSSTYSTGCGGVRPPPLVPICPAAANTGKKAGCACGRVVL